MRHKKYWVQNVRTLEELVLDADNLKEISQKTSWERKLIRIMKVYYRKGEKGSLILSY